jgi:hypothetical protein
MELKVKNPDGSYNLVDINTLLNNPITDPKDATIVALTEAVIDLDTRLSALESNK